MILHCAAKLEIQFRMCYRPFRMSQRGRRASRTSDRALQVCRGGRSYSVRSSSSTSCLLLAFGSSERFSYRLSAGRRTSGSLSERGTGGRVGLVRARAFLLPPVNPSPRFRCKTGAFLSYKSGRCFLESDFSRQSYCLLSSCLPLCFCTRFSGCYGVLVEGRRRRRSAYSS